ncbi:Transcription termination/antitermination protein NusA [Candidatus Xenohaliotis californiensis]|uniref:Transcription termination/antitermination protein NusA n=1 Tax=Candidatus Xenohaliotis californiensis TaxID=84677 RepID=A0ABP0EXH3_9RICK|nr:Transcription termination/antitermination protein NusA [Candidatus Xenohaliotis californiensis]
MTIDIYGNLELMTIVSQYAEQRGVDYDTVIKAIEDAIAIFEINKYKYEKIIVKIDRGTGCINAFKELLAIDDNKGTGIFIDGYQCVGITKARELSDDVQVGDIVCEPLPAVSLRDSARNVVFSKNALRTRLSELIRDKQYNIFKDMVGELVTGIVKRVDTKTLTVDVQSFETVMPAANLIRGELFRKGDRLKAYLSSVSKDVDSVRLNLSRIHPQFVAQLFRQEVPEIYDDIVEIKSIARAAGSRVKIAVSSKESNIDPVGACVGMRGVRVRAVIDELRGEKVDIVEYASDSATFAINALVAIEVVKVILDEKEKRMEIVVPNHQLSIAIGKRGQNVSLISVLIGWKIDILSEKDEMDRRSEEMKNGTELFMKALDVEKMMAQFLVMEGFSSIGDIANSSINDLSAIEGFDSNVAEELINRAKKYLLENEDELFKDTVKDGADLKLTILPPITPMLLLKLSTEGIETVGDLADLSSSELKEMFVKDGKEFLELNEITDSFIDELIMLAREKAGWFK